MSVVAPNVRPIWTPDEAVSRCQQCDQPFSTFKRRHHCRSCGLVFCDRCTSKKLELPHLGYERPVRICPPCYRRVTSRNAQSEPSRLQSNRTSVMYSDPQISELPSKDPAPSSPRNEEPSSPRSGEASKAHTVSSPSVLLTSSGVNTGTGSPYKSMAPRTTIKKVLQYSPAINLYPGALQSPTSPFYSPFVLLTDDLVLLILSHLNSKDLYAVSCTSSRFYALSLNNTLWCLQYCHRWGVSYSMVQRYEVNWRHIYKERIARERNNLQFYRSGRKKKKKFFSKKRDNESTEEPKVEKSSSKSKSQIQKDQFDIKKSFSKEGARVILLGSLEVGKTTLAHRFAKEDFVNHTSSTGVHFFTKTIPINDQQIRISLIDFAGNERYWSLAPLYYKTSHIALLVYDITNIKSFETAKRIHRELKVRGHSNIFIALVGTKSDLEEERRIPFVEAKEFAKKEEIEVFLEVSSKSGSNVDELFKQIAISSCFFM